MTWYELTLRRYDTNPATGAQDGGKTVSHVESDDEQVIASVMRAAADRLDPPQPVKPLYRGGVARCRGDACSEGHTYRAGCLLASPVPLRDASDLPNYAHDADCNTIHDAGPEACPPPRCSQPGHGTLGCDCDAPGTTLTSS